MLSRHSTGTAGLNHALPAERIFIMKYLPTVSETNGNRENCYDIFSRLLKERIIFISGEIDDTTSELAVAQLLYLDAIDPGKDISLYINSPGGSVTAGFAIYDTMNFIKSDVSTICVGMAASMGAFLLSAGTKGKRYVLPNAEVMIHQPLGSTGGQATDVQIAAEHLLNTKHKLCSLLAKNTGKTFDEIVSDCDRNNWKTAEEAVAYGLVDKII